MNERLLRIEEVLQIIGIKRTTLYALIKKNAFPSQYKIGNTSVWKLSDINNYIENLQEH